MKQSVRFHVVNTADSPVIIEEQDAVEGLVIPSIGETVGVIPGSDKPDNDIYRLDKVVDVQHFVYRVNDGTGSYPKMDWRQEIHVLLEKQ